MSWKGHLEVWGIWLPLDAETPARLLALWADGSRLWSANGGVLVAFPVPVPQRAEKGAGLVLVPLGAGWASFPQAKPADQEIVLRWQGEIWSATLCQLRPFDLASLWDSLSLNYLEGVPLSTPRTVTMVPEIRTEEAREVLLSFPDAAPEQKSWLRRLRESRKEKTRFNPLLGMFDLLGAYFHRAENQQYLSKMMDHFEKGQWEEALRHAIPLDNTNLEALEGYSETLVPRSALDFTTRALFGSSIGAGPEAAALLRSTYDKACDELLKEGKVREAAFVLGELLDEPTSAVDLLEQIGDYLAAARLATLKGLPAPLQVRLWFLADQPSFAMAVARRHFAHAEALLALRQSYPDLVPSFRQHWAQDIASAGRVSEALQIGWEVRQQIPQYVSWMEEALRSDGLAACQVLALAASDEQLAHHLQVGQRLTSWFGDDNPLTLPRRRQVLELLAEGKVRSSDPTLWRWAAATARKVMTQANSPFSLGGDRVLEYLVELSGDPWLQADAPRSVPRSDTRLDRWTQRIERRGQLPIFDATGLGDGRFLAALGHAGLAVLSARGALSQRFAVPAHQLVTPEDGDLHLVLSGGRLGFFSQGTYRPWCAARIDGCAQSHNGFHWLVWRGVELYQIDLAAAPGGPWQALTRLTLGSQPERVVLGQRGLAVLAPTLVQFLRNPSLQEISTELREARDIQVVTPDTKLSLVARDGQLFANGVPLATRGKIVEVDYQEPYGVVASQDGESTTLCLFALEKPRSQLVLELPGARLARVRTQGRQTVICDDQGRLLVADIEAQSWLGQFFL